MAKPRSISAKREAMVNAWEDWKAGKISGAERDERSAPFMSLAGLDIAKPGDIDQLLSIQKDTAKADRAEKVAEKAAARWESKYSQLSAKAESLSGREKLRTEAKAEKAYAKYAEYTEKANTAAAMKAESHHAEQFLKAEIRQRENDIENRLLKGEMKVIKDMEKSVMSGKKTFIERDEAIWKWRDSVERQIRAGQDKRETEQEIMRMQGWKLDTDKEPGIEWKGGTLRAGNAAGEVMPIGLAANEFADKYRRSSMPNLDILPNVNVRGIGADGNTYESKLPPEIMEQMREESRDKKQPDPSKMIAWLQAWANQYGIEEIDLYADDADEFDT